MQGFCDGETSILAWAGGVLVRYYGDRHLVHFISCKHYFIEKLTGIGAPTFVLSQSIQKYASYRKIPRSSRTTLVHVLVIVF